jgi:hypothetical protein
MKKLLISLTLLASGCAAVAHAQVPHIGSYSSMNGLPGTVSGTSAGYTGWGKNGTGDMDFIAANNGSSPSFCWYFLLGSSTITQEMCLNQSGLLVVPNGIVANVQGNLNGNASTATLATNATTAATTTGNAATATALAATPSGCGTGYQHVYAIAANGNGSCGTPVYGITTSVTSTANSANATASSTVPLFWKFGGTAAPVTMPDTAYAASCTIVSPFGFPTVTGITKGTTSITVTIMNGTSSAAVTSGGSEIDCTVTGS